MSLHPLAPPIWDYGRGSLTKLLLALHKWQQVGHALHEAYT